MFKDTILPGDSSLRGWAVRWRNPKDHARPTLTPRAHYLASAILALTVSSNDPRFVGR